MPPPPRERYFQMSHEGLEALQNRLREFVVPFTSRALGDAGSAVDVGRIQMRIVSQSRLDFLWAEVDLTWSLHLSRMSSR